MSLFLRTIQHLLPRSRAWRLPFGSQIRALFEALAETAVEDVRDHAQSIYLDWGSSTTTELERRIDEWGIPGSGNDTQDRAALLSARRATGGQGPDYLRGVLLNAGFDIHIHGPWVPASSPLTARDPRPLLDDYLIGGTQCGQSTAQCGASAAFCDAAILQRGGYIASLDLTNRWTKQQLPDDSSKWSGFLYVGGELFGDRVTIAQERRGEFERLLCKYFPAEMWLGLFVDYVEDLDGLLVTGAGGFLSTDDSGFLETN